MDSPKTLLERNLARLAAHAPGREPKNLAKTDRIEGRMGKTPVALATSTTETADWIPEDVYAQTVFMAVHADRVLGSLAAALAVDVNRGEGDTVKVRFFPARAAQGPIAEGNSLAEASSTPTVRPITIEAYGDLDTLTGQAIDFTSDDVKARVLAAMGAGISEKLESVAYGVLQNAAAPREVVLDAKGVIDYDEVLKAQEKLKTRVSAAEPAMKPDFLILSAGHERDLLKDSSLTKVADYGSAGPVALPGEIGRIGNIRVLVHPLAVAKDTATNDALQGIMIDSSRAFGEAFGKPLSYEETRIAKSNKWEEVAWAFYGAATLDEKAICHLLNPGA